MSTPSMVDRIAQALAGPEGWAAADERDRYLLRKTARIAIEAMRVATPEMIDAMRNADEDAWGPYPAWSAGIDAALDEPNQL